MGPGDLSPDHPDLGAADLLLSPVDIGDLLAKVEARITVSDGLSSVVESSGLNVLGGGGVIDALDLDQAGAGVGCPATTLEAQVATPGNRYPVSTCPSGCAATRSSMALVLEVIRKRGVEIAWPYCQVRYLSGIAQRVSDRLGELT
jgi:hypothetical protein